MPLLVNQTRYFIIPRALHVIAQTVEGLAILGTVRGAFSPAIVLKVKDAPVLLVK